MVTIKKININEVNLNRLYFSDLFNNVVTFRITDATINLPSFDMGHSGDVYFEFRTTIEDAVLFHATVNKNFNKIYLKNVIIYIIILGPN